VILSRSTRRPPAWSPRDILPTSDAVWRQATLVCLSLSTIASMVVGVFAFFMGRWAYLEYRDGSQPLWGFAAFVLLYGSFIVGPALGWIFAAREKFRSAIVAASFPVVLYAGLFLVAELSH
jgi:hypothetical protein